MGGGRVGILGICRGLAERGHQVALLATNADGKGVMDVPLGVPTEQEGVETYFYPVQFSMWGNAISFPIARALKRRVPQSDIVLVHSLYQFTSTTAAYYCRKNKVPYVLRPHGTLDPFLVYRRRWPLKWAYINLFEKKNFNAAAAIQYSSRMEEKMTGHFMNVTSPSLVIPEGIDLEKFAKLPPRGTFRAKYPETAGKVLVLFLSRFHQKKGLELLIDACARAKAGRTDAQLVLAGGGDPDYVTQVSQKVRETGLSRCITITGQLSEEEKLAALADADLFVLPSFGENFGLAVVEAMACGVPVLISDKVGIWPEIAEADAGMVAPCDPAKIADAIDRLVYDPEWRATLASRGRKLVHAHFSMDRMAERMERAYQLLCRPTGAVRVPGNSRG